MHLHQNVFDKGRGTLISPQLQVLLLVYNPIIQLLFCVLNIS